MAGKGRWEYSQIYRKAFDFLTYLDGLIGDTDLFECNDFSGFEQIKKAMFCDLTRYWQGFEGTKDTHLVHASWEERQIGMKMKGRHSASMYHGVACGNGIVGVTSKRRGLSEELCRFGCKTCETMNHILTECTGCNDFRAKARSICTKLNVDMSISRLMTDYRLQTLMEEWMIFMNKKSG